MKANDRYGNGISYDRDRDLVYAAERDAHGPRRSIGQLFGDLAGQIQTLFRLEVQLARAEVTEQAKRAGRGAGLMAAGGAVAYGGLLAFLAALGFLLGSIMPVWLGFLIAGAIALLAGALLYTAGRNALKEADISLDRTMKTLEEDALWIKHEAAEVKRDPAHLGSQRAAQ